MSSPLQRIAITGAGGHIGRAITTALITSGKHTLVALTRPESTTPLPPGIHHVVPVSYTDIPALTSVLRTHRIQFLIITLSVAAPEETHSALVTAAAAAGVQYIMPNVYGGDIFNTSLRGEDLFSAEAYKRCLEIQNTGTSAYVALCCGFWFEWSLSLGEPFFGIDIRSKKATLFDDGEEKITTSTWAQCGRAVAGLLALPEEVIEKKFRNGAVYVGSFTVSQRDMLDAVLRVTGTEEREWEVVREESEGRYKRGLEEMKAGDRLGFARALYTRAFFKDGGGGFEVTRGLDNGVLGIEKEDLDGAVKSAVEMAEKGWRPGGGYDW
ncbi:Pinoresinol reductase 2 [Podospora aff. communis PSN243]|uniref:Pinoresinol reductase 2 n=1 Tax=Podospora aff. communis PSN243 TaxID=3040156 RepID=A0AAV9GYI9_9PEZI|nr:Pinoresinol reductase 2 [Podospora aff. communis PSN243]